MKDQISRAQCRVKSGTASAEDGAESEEGICEGPAVGKVQATTVATSAEKSLGALAEIGASGSGCESGADCETQHDLLHEQQPRVEAVRAKLVGADANA
jgi:hypothetical protein